MPLHLLRSASCAAPNIVLRKPGRHPETRRALTHLEDDHHARKFDFRTDDSWSRDEECFGNLLLQEAADRPLQREDSEGCSSIPYGPTGKFSALYGRMSVVGLP